MKFKQMLKDELKGKGGLKIALEAIAFIALMSMGYCSLLMLVAIYG